jgi:hypothetical protein
MRTLPPLAASLVSLALLTACASTTVDFSGSVPNTLLCQRQADTGNVLVVWGTAWRPDQKDVAQREAAAEQGLKDYLARSNCFPGAAVRRAAAAEPLTAEHAKQLAAGGDAPFGRVVVIAVRELGPVVRLLSSAALVDGATEVVLAIGSYDAKASVPQREFTVHWKNGGPGVVKGVATLPQDMQAALAAGFERNAEPR